MKKTLSLGLAASMVLASLAACTAADDKVLVREMQDRIAIEQLLWRYARTPDSNDADGYAAVYTEDGQFGARK